MNDIEALREQNKNRLIALAVEHLHLESIKCATLPLPGTKSYIAIGEPAQIAKQLNVAPAVGIEGITDYEADYELEQHGGGHAAQVEAAGVPPTLDDIARAIFKVLRPASFAEADWESGAILGAGNADRARFVAAAEAVQKLLAAAPSAPATAPAPAELTDGAIDEVWNAMPGGADGWLKQFGYRQFARSIARHVLVRVAASMAGTIQPTDDELWEQTIGERDHNADMADKLAEAIAKHFNVDIGEHSNMNCPWAEALDVIECATPAASAQARPKPWESRVRLCPSEADLRTAMEAEITDWRAASDQAQADVRDAARYRWLRDQCPDFEAMTSHWLYDSLDTTIDAAMQSSASAEVGAQAGRKGGEQ